MDFCSSVCRGLWSNSGHLSDRFHIAESGQNNEIHLQDIVFERFQGKLWPIQSIDNAADIFRSKNAALTRSDRYASCRRGSDFAGMPDGVLGVPKIISYTLIMDD